VVEKGEGQRWHAASTQDCHNYTAGTCTHHSLCTHTMRPGAREDTHARTPTPPHAHRRRPRRRSSSSGVGCTPQAVRLSRSARRALRSASQQSTSCSTWRRRSRSRCVCRHGGRDREMFSDRRRAPRASATCACSRTRTLERERAHTNTHAGQVRDGRRDRGCSQVCAHRGAAAAPADCAQHCGGWRRR
jgi:hypothetical protein